MGNSPPWRRNGKSWSVAALMQIPSFRTRGFTRGGRVTDPTRNFGFLLCERSGQLRGIAPMMISREGLAGRLFRRMRFVGDGTGETDHMNFIVDQEDREQILASLLSAIDEMPWDIAHFNYIPESSQNANQLLQHAHERRWLVSSHAVPCPRRSLPPTAAELMAALPSRLRTAIRSARRDLFNQHAVEFGVIAKKDELREALDELYRNHAGRWQAKGETGVFVDSRKRSFYAVLSQRLLDEGALRFFYLRVDGKIAAQQYCFEHDGTVMLLQEGFDIDMSKKNVGNVLRAMVLRASHRSWLNRIRLSGGYVATQEELVRQCSGRCQHSRMQTIHDGSRRILGAPLASAI